MKPFQLPRATPTAPIKTDWTERLTECGLNASRVSVSVLQALERSDTALSHADLLRQFSADQATNPVDKVTLYRVLERLCRVGLVQAAPTTNRAQRYLLAERVQPCQFECDVCHKAVSLAVNAEISAVFDSLSEQLRAQGLTHLHMTLNAHGQCAQCKPEPHAKRL